MSTSKSLWLLARVVALSIVSAGALSAQTLIVRNAGSGSSIELQVNTEAPRTATADANGDATFVVGLPAGVDEADVRFFVDVCGSMVRVQLISPGVQPAAAAPGCNRNEAWGVFVMRRVTTFVVDIDGSNASVHLRQGPAPIEWLGPTQAGERPRKRFQDAPPTGVVLFGGVGLASLSNLVGATCGSLTTCEAGNATGLAAVGAEIWIKRFVGAQITLAKQAQLSSNGSDTNFRFTSTFDSRVMTVAGLVGGPVGPVRVYALGGANYHQSDFITTETVDDTTLVVNNVTQTLKGGTQRFEHKTEGWNWVLGGGMEAWANRIVAFYAEAQYAKLKASDVGTSEGGIDDNLLSIMVGARVHIGR